MTAGLDTAALITGGALLGGFVSGLAGFGTGLVALGFWLHAIPPAEAAALVAACSVLSQLLTIRTVWHAIDIGWLWPIVAAGLLGVPIGVAALRSIDPDRFRFTVGLLLIAFSGLMLLGRRRPHLTGESRAADVAIGFGGGVLGGLAALSGPLPIIWAALKGWSKDRRRALFQSYNLSILFAALVGYAAGGLLSADLGWWMMCAFPGTVIGAWAGARVYHRLSDRRFDVVVLWLLALSGLILVRGGP